MGALLLLLVWLLVGGSGEAGLVGSADAASTTTTVPEVQVSSETLPPVASRDQTARLAAAPAMRGQSVILVNMDDGRILLETASAGLTISSPAGSGSTSATW